MQPWHVELLDDVHAPLMLVPKEGPRLRTSLPVKMRQPRYISMAMTRSLSCCKGVLYEDGGGQWRTSQGHLQPNMFDPITRREGCGRGSYVQARFQKHSSTIWTLWYFMGSKPSTQKSGPSLWKAQTGPIFLLLPSGRAGLGSSALRKR